MVKVLDRIWLVSGRTLSHPWDANAYLIGGVEPTLIDCGGIEGYAELKANLRAVGYEPRDVQRILATHAHWDHVSATALLQAESDARLYIHEADRAAVEAGDPDLTAAYLYDRPFPPARVDGVLSDGDVLAINGLTLRVLHTPGHTPGSVCFLAECPGLRLLIAGDTLWSHYHPRGGSDLDRWQHSLDRLLELEFDAVTTGHSLPILLLDAKRRVREARRQFGVYFYPWFRPFHEEFVY